MTERADLVVVGDVYTVDAARSWASAVAIRATASSAVGTEAESASERFEAADVILRGACVLPGFQDAHIHAAFAGRILPQREPRRPARRRRLPRRGSAAYAAAHPDDCRGSSAAAGTRRFRRGRARAGPARRRRARPPRVPDEHRHARRMGQLARRSSSRASARRRPTRGTATSSATPTARRPAACRRARRTRSGPSACRADSTEDWMASIRVAQTHLHALGITGWQDAWVEPELLAAYRAPGRRRRAHDARRDRAVVGPAPRARADRRARRATARGDRRPASMPTP